MNIIYKKNKDFNLVSKIIYFIDSDKIHLKDEVEQLIKENELGSTSLFIDIIDINTTFVSDNKILLAVAYVYCEEKEK